MFISWKIKCEIKACFNRYIGAIQAMSRQAERASPTQNYEKFVTFNTARKIIVPYSNHFMQLFTIIANIV